MTPPQNIPPAAGGPSGGQLEAKTGAFYLLAMLAEMEPRGLPGSRVTRVKFQRGFEGHAFDDIIVEAEDAAGAAVVLEIQAKRTLDFTAGDTAFGKVVRQIVDGIEAGAGGPIAVAVGRTNAKIERHYQQLLVLARKVGSGAAMRSALDAPRVTSAEMRVFAAALKAQLEAHGADGSDETVWAVLRRLQILVFDFESPGAVSSLLALTMARLALPPEAAGRATDLWTALEEKALSYDADAGELDRVELVTWLRTERGIEVGASRSVALARRRFSDHSRAAIAAIDDTIAGISLDRSAIVEATRAAADRSGYVEIVGASGVGKSATLKALFDYIQLDAAPMVLSPARTPGGGWLSLSRDLRFDASADDFMAELSASGADTLLIDGLDRFGDPAVQATVTDLLVAAARTPGMRVIATVGPDFDEEQRAWLPAAALEARGRESVLVEALSDEEAAQLTRVNARLGQLLANAGTKVLARNPYQLRQLLRREGDGPLPLSEAALAESWWNAAPALQRAQQRERIRALRHLGAQVLQGAAQLDITDIASPVLEDMLRADDLVEISPGARAAFKHDLLRDWAGANVLREDGAWDDRLPLAQLAPLGLARAFELFVRMQAERETTGGAWIALVARLQQPGVHDSWLRMALLALVRSEQATAVLDRALPVLVDNRGVLFKALIRNTLTTESESPVERLVAAGIAREQVPAILRVPVNLSWARLVIWLLDRLDDLQAPVGVDVLHFFAAWLTANARSDPFRPLIVAHLYGWLTVLEGRSDADGRAATVALFADDGASLTSTAIIREIRGMFLSFCDGNPDLAARYLAVHTRDGERYDVTSEILKLSQGTAKAAPAALAAFVVEALIEAEKRYRGRGGTRTGRRLESHTDIWLTPGPGKGPFLGILRADAKVGLRLVRQIVDYGIGLDGRDLSALPGFEVEAVGTRVRVVAPGSYLLSRDLSGGVATSSLRSLETWAHEQVQGGRPFSAVIRDVLGEGDVAAAFVAVAMDILLTYADLADPLLVPFGTIPELLALDWERYVRDGTGLNGMRDDDAGFGAPTNAQLLASASRRTALSWAMARFSLDESQLLREVRTTLEAERDRLVSAGADPSALGRGPLWHVNHTLNIINRDNWREVVVGADANGETVTALQYVEPPEEAAELDPIRSSSNASLAETMLLSEVVEAALDPGARSNELLDRALVWVETQPWATLTETEEDFEQAHKWRAVVATAGLTLLPGGREARRDWARDVLRRAVEIAPPERPTQIRFDAIALSVVGWGALVLDGDQEARDRVLELAGRDRRTIVAAFGGMISDLSRADDRLPRALLRIGLTASVHAERTDDREEVEVRKRRRRQAVADAIAAEKAWLAGGDEPPWPDLPRLRRPERRRGVRLPPAEGVAPSLPPPEPPRPPRAETWFNHQSGGHWLAVVDGSHEVRVQAWVTDLVERYTAFSDEGWGLGLERSSRSDHLATEWLTAFDRLRLRAHIARADGEYEALVCRPLTGLPDQTFLDAAENLVPALDSLFFDEGLAPQDRLVATRAEIVTRLMATRDWRYRHDEVTDTVSRDIAGLIQALFLHVREPFGMGACYLPADGERFTSVLPALLTLTTDAPGRGYVAAHFVSLLERAQAWAPLEIVVAAAEAWMTARPDDTQFWRDQGTGRSICGIVAARLPDFATVEPELRARARRLMENFISIGVPEALSLEAQLASQA